MLSKLKPLLEFISDRDARIALVLSVTILVIIMVGWFAQTFGGVMSLEAFRGALKAIFQTIIAVSSFIVFFKAVDGTAIPRVIVWYFTSIILITFTAFWFQAILKTPAPYLVEAKCFADPWHEGCPLGKVEATKVAIAPPPQGGGIGSVDAIAEKSNRVYIHFAGSIARDKVRESARALSAAGWTVPEADKGGERIASAAGLNQVRYFHEGDRSLATSLATRYNQIAAWKNYTPISVGFIGGFETKVPQGHLEIWASVN